MNTQYSNADTALFQQFGAGQIREPLLRYALDPDYLPDHLYQALPADLATEPDPVTEILRIPWFMGLYWVRRFFEEGDGNNYQQILRAALSSIPQALTQSVFDQLWQRIDQAWQLPLPDAKRRQRFLGECWMVRHGAFSQLWRHLVPLSRQLPNILESSMLEDQVRRYADGEQLPRYLDWLCDEVSPAFLDSLQASRPFMPAAGTQGTGWLQPLKDTWSEHTSCNHATADWMLYVNGSQMRILLVVRSIHVERGSRELRLAQGSGVELVAPVPDSGQLHFDLTQLAESGFTEDEAIRVYVGKDKVTTAKPPEIITRADSPVLFRYPENSLYLPAIVPDEPGEHVFAPRLAVLWPGPVPAGDLTHGGRTLTHQPIGATRSWPGATPRGVSKLEFEGLATSAPELLSWSCRETAVPLLMIGPKPYLHLANACDRIRCVHPFEARVVLGNSCEVELRNQPVGTTQQAWRVTGGEMEFDPQTLSSRCLIRMKDEGREVRVACGKSVTTLVFLPCWIGETRLEPKEEGIWKYEPESRMDHIVAAARLNRSEAVLSRQDFLLRISRTLEKPTWWWEKGLGAEHVEYIETRDFGDYKALTSQRLCIATPEGKSSLLTFRQAGGKAAAKLCEFEGPSCDSIWIEQELSRHLDFREGLGDKVDKLNLNGSTVARIRRIPNRPALTMKEGIPSLYFPESGFSATRYSIICVRESELLLGKIGKLSLSGFLDCGSQAIPEQLWRSAEDNGTWLLLGEGQVSGSRTDGLLVSFRTNEFRIQDVLEYQASGPAPLRARLGIGVDGDPDNGHLTMVRLLLDYLAERPRKPLLNRAVHERDTIEYTSDPEFWMRYFRSHCGIEQLEETLRVMLKSGFNFLAIPRWLEDAHATIKRASTHSGKWGKAQEKSLRDQCPVISNRVCIVNGWPFGGGILPGFPGNLLKFPPSTFAVSCSTSVIPKFQVPIELHEIAAAGLRLAAGFGWRKGEFDGKRCRCLIRDPSGAPVPFKLHILDVNRAARHLAERMDDVQELLLTQRGWGTRLNRAFELACSALVTGEPLGAGLGSLLRDVSAALVMEAEHDPEQVNRAAIFQAVFLSRLNALSGITTGADAPLADAAAEHLVCAVVRAAWCNPGCREILLRDLMRIDWLLTWFRN